MAEKVLYEFFLSPNFRNLKKKKSNTERNFQKEISIYVFISIITMSKDCNLGVGNENNLKGGKRI